LAHVKSYSNVDFGNILQNSKVNSNQIVVTVRFGSIADTRFPHTSASIGGGVSEENVEIK